MKMHETPHEMWKLIYFFVELNSKQLDTKFINKKLKVRKNLFFFSISIWEIFFGRFHIWRKLSKIWFRLHPLNRSVHLIFKKIYSLTVSFYDSDNNKNDVYNTLFDMLPWIKKYIKWWYRRKRIMVSNYLCDVASKWVMTTTRALLSEKFAYSLIWLSLWQKYHYSCITDLKF